MKLIVLLWGAASLVACSEGNLPDTNQAVEQSSEQTPAPVDPVVVPQADPLTITASLAQIAIKQTTSFSAAGGAGGYTFAVVGTSAGTLSNGIYTASIVGETVNVQVKDSAGAMKQTSVTVAWPATRDVLRARAGNGAHFFTTNAADGNFGVYTQAQGVGYRVLQAAIDDQTKPLYRCLNTISGKYFETDQASCENPPGFANYQMSATFGHVYKTARPGLVPLARYASGPNDYVDSIKGDLDPDVGGHTRDGVLGYVLPPAN